ERAGGVITPAVALLATLAVQAAPDSAGATLYRAWCASCHGADGRGQAARQTQLSVRPADLTECQTSTAETEERWLGIVREGGAGGRSWRRGRARCSTRSTGRSTA